MTIPVLLGRALLAAVVLGLPNSSSPLAFPQTTPNEVQRQHVAWVAECLRQMETVKPGMTLTSPLLQ